MQEKACVWKGKEKETMGKKRGKLKPPSTKGRGPGGEHKPYPVMPRKTGRCKNRSLNTKKGERKGGTRHQVYGREEQESARGETRDGRWRSEEITSIRKKKKTLPLPEGRKWDEKKGEAISGIAAQKEGDRGGKKGISPAKIEEKEKHWSQTQKCMVHLNP